MSDEPILQFFAYEHLPAHLKSHSQPFHALAHALVGWLPRNPERSVALRKLLEAKDAAVRAILYKEPVPAANVIDGEHAAQARAQDGSSVLFRPASGIPGLPARTDVFEEADRYPDWLVLI